MIARAQDRTYEEVADKTVKPAQQLPMLNVSNPIELNY
jgi:hypothetical protein